MKTILSIITIFIFSSINAQIKSRQLNFIDSTGKMYINDLNRLNPLQRKSFVFEQAYVSFQYDTTNNSWDTLSRTTEWMESASIGVNKYSLGKKNEIYRNGQWINSDSTVQYGDTSIGRWRLPFNVGFIDTMKQFFWDTTNSKWNLNSISYLTESNGKILKYNAYSINHVSGSLRPKSELIFKYDLNQKLEEYIYSTEKFYFFPRFSIVFTKSDSVIINLNADNFIIEETFYPYKNGLWDSIPQIKYDYTKDIRGNTLIDEYSYFNNSLNRFEKTSKTSTTYDQNRNVITDSVFSYLSTSQMYFLNRFNHSVYNQGQIQSKSYFSVNNNIGTLYHKDDYYYNSNVLDSLIESEYFSWGTYFDRKNIYYHTPFGTTVSLVRQAIENPNAFYPNPSSQSIQFNKPTTARIHIINISGHLIESIPQNISEYDVSHLKNGIYFLKSANSIQKLVKH